MVEIYRWYLFHLGAWGRKVKKLFRNPEQNSPNNKVLCRVIGCYSLSEIRPNWHPYHCTKSCWYSQALLRSLLRSVLPKIDVVILVHVVRTSLFVSFASWWKKVQLLESEILTKFITFANHLAAIPKTQYTL